MSDFEEKIDKISEKFLQIQNQFKIDCKINRSDPFDRFNTELLEKWIRRRTEWSKLCKAYEDKKKERFRSLYEYYKTDFDVKLSTKDEYSLFIESDASYTTINTLYQNTKEVLVYIDAIVDTLKQRQWEIRAYIDYLKWSNGNQ